MAPTDQAAEQLAGVSVVGGFAERRAVEDHLGVRREHDRAGVAGCDDVGLVGRDAHDVLGGELPGQWAFIDIRGVDLEAQPGAGEQLGAPW